MDKKWITNTGVAPRPGTTVVVEFVNDDHQTIPIPSEDVDWSLHHRDPVRRYQIVAPPIGKPKIRSQENA